MDKRRELKMVYKETPRPMGVYQIKNCTNGKILVGSSMNVPAKCNSDKFQLNYKVHRNAALQADWNKNSPEDFSFEVLETIKAEEIPQEDWRAAVKKLEEKWLNTLQPYGEKGYNKS
ncbi:hypothetical protein SRRS_44460 [Sporomusa rhizae]|uniref:GIY-YIG nuclease family protein n=1 Tax=Sporomusa rhizae TaxID=357999 RepID=UPI00352BD082